MNSRKKPALGRNLSAMLSPSTLDEVRHPAGGELRNLPLDVIRPGRYQPRSVFDEEKLAELADSIRAQGVVQPVVVRPVGDDAYELIAGERRWRAAQIAGAEHIPAVVQDVPDEISVAMALIENIQREDLNPLEEATALRRLIDDFQMTHQEAADAVGRSRAAVSNLLRLQDLADKVKPLLETRQLEMGHARALLGITDPVQQYDAARQVAKKGLSVRETERLVARMLDQGPGKKTARPAAEKSADIRRLETEVSEKLGAKVRLDHGKKGSGKLVISYNNLDELDGILKHIK